MWTMLTLFVVAASLPAPSEGLAFGSRVRLSAGPRVSVPSLVSGTERAGGQRPYKESDGLLVFEGADGSPAAVISPGATIEGTLVGADPAFLHVQRAKKGPADRIDRTCVARVQVLVRQGHATRKGALIGGGAGALVGSGYYWVFSALDETGSDHRALEFLVSAAVGGAAGALVGAGLGLLGTNDVWREIPKSALPDRAVAGAEGPTDDRALVYDPGGPTPLRQAMAELSATGPRP